MDNAAIDDRLIRGLHRNRWTETMDELLSDASLEAGGRAHLLEIASRFDTFVVEAERVRSEIIEALKAHGIEARPVGGVGPDSTATLRIAKGEGPNARGVLEDLGFIDMYRLRRGALKALETATMRLSMATLDGPLARVNLCWGTPGDLTTWLRWTRPSTTDVSLVALPSTLWWVYWLVRPVRLIWARLSGGRANPQPARFLATPIPMIGRLLDLARPDRDDLVVDLGCGDGRVLIEGAVRYGCRGLGVETNSDLADLARTRVADEGLDERVVIESGDLKSIDISQASVVFAFLPAGDLSRLLPEVLQRLPGGARVVTHEQAPVSFATPPGERELIVDESGVTVSYVWWI